MGDEEKGFKVRDRRGESTASSDEQKKGDGFTMKETQAADAAPNELDFSTFIFSLATGALINMGLAPDPMTKKVEKNLDLAKQNIDLLGIMKDKTKGNLSPAENALMENLLTEVRLRYVEAAKQK